MDRYQQTYPQSTLLASGKAVGLPAGQMGNSEVGHLHIGAGRVVEQSLWRINQAIASGSFASNPTLAGFLQARKERKQTVHIMGLVSTGGVHADLGHIKAMLRACADRGIEKVVVHGFLDGRDMPPCSAAPLVQTLVEAIAATPGAVLGSLMGRYYAMDRNQRWDRTAVAYEAIVHGKGTEATDPIAALTHAYGQQQTDEFIRPLVFGHTLEAGDAVIGCNFRPDRARQLTEALCFNCLNDLNDLNRTPATTMPIGIVPLAIDMLTMTPYHEAYTLSTIFDNIYVQQSLGEVISAAGGSQLRLAETEKYPHVTYFFSGRKEAAFPNETRVLCPSPSVATYDLAPEMAAKAVTQALLQRFAQEQFDDFICLNFANPDMVGHTGNLKATIQGCSVVDACLGQVVAAAQQAQYGIMIVADHGNAECMRHPNGTPHTAHTTNPVPCVLMSSGATRPIQNGQLGNIAPTILAQMELPIPQQMTFDPLDVN